ncbi:MAG: glycosyltransferase family 9 protein, partial [Acidobacteria bacterium]|nr:glycosyltransferase family 9 protein [Acidobacteriota bacterium]
MRKGSPEPASGANERILVIRPGAMGDIFRTLPAVHCLRGRFPDARVTWLVFDTWREILEGQPGIDELIELRRSAGNGVPLLRLAGRLRRERFTLTLDFQGTFRSGLLARLSHCPRRFGFSRRFSREGNFLFNNHRVTVASPFLNRVEKNLALVRALGARTDIPYPGYRVDEGDRRIAEEWLLGLGPPASPIVLLVPGSSRRQAHKRWPPVHFSRLASLLRGQGFSPLIAWGPGERHLAEGIAMDSG